MLAPPLPVDLGSLAVPAIGEHDHLLEGPTA